MMRSKDSTLNGLFLTSSRPLHPLVAEYLARKGCKISYEDGYIIMDGNYSLPNQKRLFAELIELSKELYGEVNFDLDVQVKTTPHWGSMRSFEVVDKNPNKEAKVSTIKVEGYDQEIIDLLFIAYLLLVDSVVYLGANREICYLAGDEPLDKNKLIADATKFIKKEIVRIKIQKNSISTLDINEDTNHSSVSEINPEFYDLLMFKYFLEKNCQIAIKGDSTIFIGGNIPSDVESLDKEIEEFQITEFAKLQARGLSFEVNKIQEQQQDMDVEMAAPAAPGLFAAFSNWVWGSSQKSVENTANDAPKPKPTP